MEFVKEFGGLVLAVVFVVITIMSAYWVVATYARWLFL
jgi:hypothetical protein